jgi:hypothetical protein
VAIKKTTSATGAPKRAAAKRKPAAVGAKKGPPKSEPSKTEPVILDPPIKSKAAAAKKPAEVIDAKVVAVDPPKPDVKPEKPAQAAKAKVADDGVEKPVTASRGTRAFAGYLAGGAVAALFGYLAAGYINPPAPLSELNSEISELSSAYDAKIGKLEARIDELENSPVSVLEQDLADLKTAVSDQATQVSRRLTETEANLSTTLQELETARGRLAETLSQSGGEISVATAELIARYGDEIAELKSLIAQQVTDNAELTQRLDVVAAQATAQLSSAKAKVEELSEDIVATASNVDLTLAFERLRTAIEAGKPYGDLLTVLATDAAVEIPVALKEAAANGVDSLATLQKSFPEAARRALKASIQSEAGEGIGEKIAAYFKAQIGARSLEEKEGDDPDAILSRVEAALGRSELQAAVDLARKLPEDGIAELKDWLDIAETRLKVKEAMQEFSDALSGNE